ncbi:MAG TPA: PAS domain S-box protein [Bacteroidota bacterium]
MTSDAVQNLLKNIVTILVFLLLVFSSESLQSRDLLSDSVLTVTEARVDANNDGIPDLLGRRVTIAGRANVYSGVIHTDRLVVFLEDENSGIGIYSTEFGAPIAEGDSVIATGIVDQFEGLTRLSHVTYRTFIVLRPLPLPLFVDIERANSERYEGRLIQVEGRVSSKWKDAYGSYISLREHEGDKDSMVVFLIFRHKPGIDFEKLSVGETVRMTGVLAQFAHGGAQGGYEMFPRYPEDVEVVADSSRSYLVVIYISAVAFLLALFWGFVLRRRVNKQSRKLKESEDRSRSIFDGAEDGILVLTKDLTIEDANPAACHLFQRDRASMIGIALEHLLNAEGLHEFGRMLDTDASSRVYEFEATLADGGEIGIHLLAKMNLISVDDGVRIILILRDITVRTRAEKALKTSEEYHRMLFEASPLPLWVYDLETLRFLAVNEAAVQHYGYSKEEFESMTLKDIRPPEEVPMLLEDIVQAQKGQSGTSTWRHRRKDGSIIEVEISAHDFVFSGRMARLVLANDVTERKVAEEQRHKLEAQLLQAQRLESIGTLAAGIAHDFNNILNIILGNASLLHSKLGDAETIRRRASTIINSVERGANLVKQLLTYARKTGVVQEPTDVNKLVLDTIKLLGETFSKSIEMSAGVAGELPLIIADANQLNQVLLNLSVNARDAMPNGGKIRFETGIVSHSEIRVRFPQATSKSYVFIRVKDTGTGMDEAVQRRIFDPFYTTKGSAKGSGLGLSVVLGIVESHRGFVDVQSRIGEGSEFTVYLPASPRVRDEVLISNVSEQTMPRGSETILFIDDEELTREAAVDILHATGYKVLTAKDGEEAVDVYARHAGEISLVLSDMGLPKFGGDEVFRRIRHHNPHVLFILLTGFIEPEMARSLRAMGVRDIMMKPYVHADLLNKMREVLKK